MVRISWTSGAPTTEFYAEIVRSSQNYGGNYTTVAIYLGAINRGSTGSFSNWYGEQVASIDGVWGSAVHSGNPFLPSGYGTGQQRWYDGAWYVDIPHDGNGYRGGVTFRMRVTYNNGTNVEFTAWFDDFPRIPKVPQAPYNLAVDQITTGSFGVSYARGDNMGAGIDQDQAEWSRLSDGVVVWNDYGPNTYTNPAGAGMPNLLSPGTDYRVRIRSHNSQGWGPWSGYVTARTLAAARVRVGGVYVYAIPYVKINGVWVQVQPFLKVAGSWKRAT